LYQSKYYEVKIASDFEPASWRKNSPSRRRRDSKFVWKNGGKSVGRALRRPQFDLRKTLEFNTGVSILPSSHLFSKSLNESPRHRLASLGNPKKKKVPCFSDFAGVIFS
jgi:hypothetical protein